jgi:hypothetical protein
VTPASVRSERECIGIELPQNPQGKQHFATRAARKPAQSRFDPDLASLISAWATLPEPIRRAVLKLLGAAPRV